MLSRINKARQAVDRLRAIDPTWREFQTDEKRALADFTPMPESTKPKPDAAGAI